MLATTNRSRWRGKTTYHHGDLRQALLDEARLLMREGGLGSFTLREVARCAGVTHAAGYRHFTDKNALAVEIGEIGYAALGRLEEALAPIPGSPCARRPLRAARSRSA